MAHLIDNDSVDNSQVPKADHTSVESAAPERQAQEVETAFDNVVEPQFDETDDKIATIQLAEAQADGANAEGAPSGVLTSGGLYVVGDYFSFLDALSLNEQASSSLSLNRFSTTNVNDFASNVESYLAPTDVRPEARIEFTSSIDSELSTDTFIAADTAPVTDAATAVGAEDAVSISITLTGGDIDGTVTSYSLSTLPANGTLYTNVGLTTAAATGHRLRRDGRELLSKVDGAVKSCWPMACLYRSLRFGEEYLPVSALLVDKT